MRRGFDSFGCVDVVQWTGPIRAGDSVSTSRHFLSMRFISMDGSARTERPNLICHDMIVLAIAARINASQKWTLEKAK
jgi:hypothetical protein